MFRHLGLLATAVGVLGSVAAWYLHAHRFLGDGGLTFGIWEYGSDKWGNWDLVASWGFWNGVVFRSLAERWFTWAGFGILVVGLALPRRDHRAKLYDVWLLAVLIYLLIVARGNYVHEYYQLPFLPVAVVFMGSVFARYWGASWKAASRVLLVVSLVATAGLSAWRLGDYLRREDAARSTEFQLAKEVRQRTEPGALLITAEGGNPTVLYLAHRKGWAVARGALTPSSLERMRSDGARYLVSTRDLWTGSEVVAGAVPLGTLEAVYRGEHGSIARLEGTEPPTQLERGP